MLSSNNSNKREIVSLKTILLSIAASKILSYLNNKDYLQNPFLYYEYYVFYSCFIVYLLQVNIFFLCNILWILLTQLQAHPNEPSNFR